MKDSKVKNLIFKRDEKLYPLAKSKRKSWNPTLLRSHRSHPMMSFLTKSWVWSIFGNPWKMAPVLRLPWKEKKWKKVHQREYAGGSVESVKNMLTIKNILPNHQYMMSQHVHPMIKEFHHNDYTSLHVLGLCHNDDWLLCQPLIWPCTASSFEEKLLADAQNHMSY